MSVKECRRRLQELLDILDRLPPEVSISSAHVASYSNSEIMLRDDLKKTAKSFGLEVQTRSGANRRDRWTQQTAVLDQIVLVHMDIQSGG